MAASAYSANRRFRAAWQASAIILGAVAMCLLLATLASALTKRLGAPTPRDIARESAPRPVRAPTPLPLDEPESTPPAAPTPPARPNALRPRFESTPPPDEAPSRAMPVEEPMDAAARGVELRDAASRDALLAEPLAGASTPDAALSNAAPLDGGPTDAASDAAPDATPDAAPDASGVPSLPLPPVSMPCGPNTCNVGLYCCNPTCGICRRPGETCSEKPCG